MIEVEHMPWKLGQWEVYIDRCTKKGMGSCNWMKTNCECEFDDVRRDEPHFILNLVDPCKELTIDWLDPNAGWGDVKTGDGVGQIPSSKLLSEFIRVEAT